MYKMETCIDRYHKALQSRDKDFHGFCNLFRDCEVTDFQLSKRLFWHHCWAQSATPRSPPFPMELADYCREYICCELETLSPKQRVILNSDFVLLHPPSLIDATSCSLHEYCRLTVKCEFNTLDVAARLYLNGQYVKTVSPREKPSRLTLAEYCRKTIGCELKRLVPATRVELASQFSQTFTFPTTSVHEPLDLSVYCTEHLACDLSELSIVERIALNGLFVKTVTPTKKPAGLYLPEYCRRTMGCELKALVCIPKMIKLNDHFLEVYMPSTEYDHYDNEEDALKVFCRGSLNCELDDLHSEAAGLIRDQFRRVYKSSTVGQHSITMSGLFEAIWQFAVTSCLPPRHTSEG